MKQNNNRDNNRDPNKRKDFKPFSKNKPAPFKSKQDRFEQPRMATPPDYDMKGARKNAKNHPNADLPKISQDLRLNRVLSNAGIASRRDADELIKQGYVKVNGNTVLEMGFKVKPSDVVTFKGQPVRREKLIYVLLNKPKGYITTTEDPQERKTVMDLVRNACTERIYPVGRLDRATTGLLLLTNDGHLADKLMHPSHNVRKGYKITLTEPLQPEDFDKIRNGLDLEDGFIKPDEFKPLTIDGLEFDMTIHSGKNHIVRRIFEHLGYTVLRLDRIRFAGLTKKDLERGKWRYLRENEVVRLKYFKLG